jgi:hypothetical protein
MRVTRTDKSTHWSGGQHRHIAALCLEDSRRVAKATAIDNIRRGIESYYTLANGLRANVEVVNSCDRCFDSYLRTDRDPATSNNLLELPDC